MHLSFALSLLLATSTLISAAPVAGTPAFDAALAAAREGRHHRGGDSPNAKAGAIARREDDDDNKNNDIDTFGAGALASAVARRGDDVDGTIADVVASVFDEWDAAEGDAGGAAAASAS